MAAFDWPTGISPVASSFYLQPHTGGSESPFSRVTKTYGLSAPRWTCRVVVRLPRHGMFGVRAAQGRALDAFLARLKGRLNVVRLWDFDVPGEAKPFGNAAASAGATTMTLTGASTGDILVGEYLGGDGRPHIITDLAVSGSDLVATFEPPLRTDVAAGAATFEKVAGLFRLTSDDGGQNFNEVGQYAEYALDFVEDPNAPLDEIILLPAAFNDQLGLTATWSGSTIDFDVNPYDAIDVVGSGSGATHFYIDYDTGADTNDGLSAGTAFKTFEKAADAVDALANGAKAIIHLLDDYVDYLQSFSLEYSEFDGRHTKIRGEGPSGRTKFLSMRRDYTQAAFAWVAHGSGAWKSNAGVAGNYPLQFFLDGNRIPSPIVSAGQSAASVGTTELRSWWDGTWLYVHLPGGVKPDPYVNWEYSNNTGGLDFRMDSGTLLFENCDFFHSASGANFPCLRTRSVTDSDFTSTASLGLRNCVGYGSSGNVFEFKDQQIIALDQCQAAFARLDLFNYHANQPTGTKGAYISVYETNCSGHDAGYAGFNDGASTSTSDNGSTAHDSINILRANCSYDTTLGAVVADVVGTVTVCLNVTPSSPTGAANPKALFWHSGTGAGANHGMYLAYCRGNDGGDSSIILLDNSGTPNGEADGQIYIEHWLGQRDGTVIGTLKDWSGNTLASLADAS